MRSNTFRHFFAVLLTFAVLLAGKVNVWANPTTGVGVSIFGYTNGTVYVYAVSSSAGPTYQCGPTTGTQIYFDSRSAESQFNIGSNGITRDLTMTLDGSIAFANGTNATDVTTNGRVGIDFTSANYYIVDAAVTTRAGTTVEGCTVSGTYTKTLTVTIPSNTTFSTINIAIATYTPLNYCTISGIEDCYIDDGVNEPVPSVTLEGKTLRQDVDYILSYTHSTTGGGVIVTGAGDYVGSKYQHYDTREPNLSDLHALGDNIYEIATQQDLDYLARIVNGKGAGSTSNDCSGLTFRQTADIAYNYTNAWDNIYHTLVDLENNFTPIGRYGKSFQGTYDGQNHTISGIRVDKFSAGSNHDNQSLGLFGYVLGGTVQNIVLRDSYIRGYQDLGGIVGYLSGGTVSGCTLHHVTVSTFTTDYITYHADVVVGNLASGTVSTSHYRDCCLGRLLNNGKGQYNDPQNEVFALTLASGVTASKTSGESVTIDGETYYTEGSTFTLGYSGDVPTGYTHSGYSATGTTIDGSTLTMPNTDITVSATWTPAAGRNLTATAASLFGESKYVTTFYHGTLDYQLPSGAKAYTASLDGEKVVFHLVGEDGSVIPHGTAVIIVADAASVTLSTLASTEVTAYAGNILIGSNSEVTVSGLSGIPYVLNISDGTLGLYKFTGESIPAGKAYYLKSE